MERPRSVSALRAPIAALLLLLTPHVAQGQAPAAPAAPPPAAPAPPALVPPKLLSDAEVPYPEGATGDATVLLTLVVGPDGAVLSVEAMEVHEPFASVAASAARRWRFQPARRDGAAIGAKIRFSVTFTEPPKLVDPSPAAVSPDPGAPAAPARPPLAPAKPVEVTVVGDRPDPSRTATLTRAEVREIPGTFGDPFRAIEIMPGVTPILSGLPFFFIRGAPPGDVGYFLDGIRVPLLFHIGIGPSVVHPGLISRVDLYPGGYPARYGRFAGGIVAGETTAPLPDLHGEYNVRLFDAGVMAEAPFADGRGTVLLGGRYSYTAALLSLLQSTAELNYWDYQARATYRLNRDDTIGVFAFGSYDYLGQRTPTQTITVFGAEFHRVDARYDHKMADDGAIRFAVTAGVDRSRLPDDRFVQSQLLGTRTEMAVRLAPGALLRAGSDVEVSSYQVKLVNADSGGQAAQVAAMFPTRTDITTGVRADVIIGVQPGFEVTPGIRFDFYGSSGATALGIDPRIASRLAITEHTRLLSAAGIAHQPPAFVVPLPGFQPGGIQGGLQRAIQESIGIERDIDPAATGTITVFHNAFFNMSDPLSSAPRAISGCPLGGLPSDSLGGDRGSLPTGGGGGGGCGPPRFGPGVVGPDRAGGGGQAADNGATPNRTTTALETRTLGTAYGLELFLKRKMTSRIGGFLSYTLSRSVRMVGNKEFTATFDRTHVMNAAVAYNLGRNWRAGSRLVYYTGVPKAPDPTDPSATRLPSFYRIDLRLEKRWILGEHSWISFVAEWMNVTLRKEAVSTRCTLQGCETQTVGPITIPSVGVEGGFLS